MAQGTILNVPDIIKQNNTGSQYIPQDSSPVIDGMDAIQTYIDNSKSFYVDNPDSVNLRSTIARQTGAKPQGFFLIVDRSISSQTMDLMYAQNNEWYYITSTHVSTGKPGRKEHFKTPTGVFIYNGDIMGYRALGTYNQNHIRGIGLKNSRVWDFGWQSTEDWKTPGATTQIRMEMHATDPANLEHRIGRPDSEGCIRIHADVNKLLDEYGILDHDTNMDAQSGDNGWASLLGSHHHFLNSAGNTLIIIDSSTSQKS